MKVWLEGWLKFERCRIIAKSWTPLGKAKCSARNL